MRRRLNEFIRYVANGLIATAVHYLALTFFLQTLDLPSAGLANLIAACFGITCSFLGSRYFVFRRHDMPLAMQAAKFAGLYSSIALLHGALLLVWTDWAGFDYRIGFLFATSVQFALSYLGNKLLVFR